MTTKLNLTSVDKWNIFPDINHPLLISGPCSAESREQVLTIAKELKDNGVNVFRAGVWKPRTRPNCFEGIGSQALEWLAEAQTEFGLKVSTEVANAKHVEEVLKSGVDMLWIGARTSANPFAVQDIVDALKGVDIPVLVKNPINPDVELWTGALERLNLAGLTKLGVIHRGFSAYGDHKYRNHPQWQLAIEMKHRFPELLMICDPSHIAGKREYLQEISQRAMDLGFDGLIIESHNNPQNALSDASQQIEPSKLKILISNLILRNNDCDNSTYHENIDVLRRNIDQIDNEILDILYQRMELVEKIGTYKKQNSITILQSTRWESILEHIYTKGTEKGLDKELLEKVFSAIHQASIESQTKVMNS